MAAAELGIAACMKEIEILPAMTYRCRGLGRDFDEAAALAAAPDIGPTIITHRFPLDGCVEAFATAADRSSGTIKVAFDPDRRPLGQARRPPTVETTATRPVPASTSSTRTSRVRCGRSSPRPGSLPAPPSPPADNE